MDETVSIEGIIENITFQNDENGFTVLEFSSDGEFYIAAGNIGNVYVGEKVTFLGTFVVHPTFGRQLKVENCIRSVPESANEMLMFLSSGMIKGIRERMAQKIVSEFGEETFNIIENEPKRLTKIKGISREKANEISKCFHKFANERNAVIALGKYGLSTNEAIKVYKKFGSKSADIVERNPYLLSNLGIGITFERTCAIANNLQNKPLDEYRIQAGIIYVMKHNLGNGHTCIPRTALLDPCKSLLDCSEDDVEINLDILIEHKSLISTEIRSRDYIFLPDLYEAEKSAAQNLLFIKRYATKSFPNIENQIKKAELVGGVVYNETQKKAIKIAVEKGILVLTGGPGTGKTTTLRGILSVFKDQGLDVALAAPTGRAAKRMSELTGEEAITIHRLLEVEWDESDHPRFKRNRQNLLESDAVIIDELSMVDIQLFSSLLEALPIGCRLVMVGDSDQLPPVGAGNVLHDIIDSNALPVVQLNEVFRQAMESLIITNAHKIVNGEMPILDVKDKDFFFMEKNSAAYAANTIRELLAIRLPAAYNISPIEDIQVLCPSRKGETGTVSLNKILQSALNPPEKNKKEHAFGSRVFRTGDKLMQIKNNYDIEWHTEDKTGQGVFNGDIGILEKIDNDSNTFIIRFDDRVAEIPFECSPELEHAYAVTVHKSQGSEFPVVVIPVVGINEYLQYRNLLYTAVTRAKNIIILVGSKNTVYRMVENNKKQKRYSALSSFIVQGEDL